MAARGKKRRRADGSLASGKMLDASPPPIPPAKAELFQDAFETYCENLKDAADNIEASAVEGVETAGIVATMLDLAEKHGEAVADPLALRSAYLLRMIESSDRIRLLSCDEDPEIQSALQEAVCKMPMTAATGPRPLIHWLQERGIKLPE